MGNLQCIKYKNHRQNAEQISEKEKQSFAHSMNYRAREIGNCKMNIKSEKNKPQALLSP